MPYRLLSICQRIGVLILFALSSFLLSGCWEDFTEEKNKLVIGMASDYPPFEFLQGDKIVGYDVDLITKITKILRKEPVIKSIPFYMLLAATQSGEIDLAISAISQTPAREERVSFSDVYYNTHMAILYRPDPDRAQPWSDLSDLNGKKVGVRTGTVFYDFIMEQKNAGLDVQIIIRENTMIILDELKDGLIDAAVVESATATNMAKKESLLFFILNQFVAQNYAIAMPKNSPLIPQINDALAKVVSSGGLDKLEKEWLPSE